MSRDAKSDAGGRSLGPVLILVGVVAVVLARGIPESSLGNNQDPGPRAFPLGLGLFLILGGLYEVLRVFLQRRGDRSGVRGESWVAGLRAAVARRENRNAFLLLVALGIYLAAMPWLGFGLSTLVFSAGMMRLFGARWRSAAAVSVALVVTVHLLFVVLFKVQLPVGVLGLSW